jgi:hypothetical protein
MALEKQIKTDALKTGEALEECIHQAREDVDRPRRKLTLIEMVNIGATKTNGAANSNQS